MSCDFKPGDAVIYIEEDWPIFGLVSQATYTVTEVLPPLASDMSGLLLAELPRPSSNPRQGFSHTMFRKVIRRDLGAWLETATDFEEPKRAPAKVQSGDLHAAADAPTGGVALPLAVPGRSNPLPQGASHE